MTDWLEIDRRFHELLRANHLTQAETFLLKCYAEPKGVNHTEDLDYVLSCLTQYYSMPEVEDCRKAERFALEREVISPGSYAKLQTATFYFYVPRDFSKTIDKINEMRSHSESRNSPDYYSGLSLKGQSLLELKRVEEAAQVLDEMLDMVQPSGAQLPYGNEMNFLEKAISIAALEAKCRNIVVGLIPRIRSQEYVEKAKKLLNYKNYDGG
jgi:hypothetical protein